MGLVAVCMAGNSTFLSLPMIPLALGLLTMMTRLNSSEDTASEDISDDDSEESESSSEDERVEEHVRRAGLDVPLVVKIENMEDFVSESSNQFVT